MASRIEILAKMVQESTRVVSGHLRSHDLPFPSFDADGPTDLVLQDGQAENARNEAMAACLELYDLLQGPQMCIRPCYNGAPLQTIYKYELARKVPLKGAISFADLANACGMHEPDLRSVIRYAIVYHRCFCEPEKGMVAHSAASRQLAENADARDAIGYMFDGNFQSFGRTFEAIDNAKHQAKDPHQTGWALAHGSKGGFFDDLEANPALANRFQGSMRFFGKTVSGQDPAVLAEKYPWDQLGPGSAVVDVGGGDGSVGRVLAETYPNLRIIVQDQPHVIAPVQTSTDLPANLSFVATNFFERQPVQGAQVYLLRWVLHDWPDNYAVKILQSLIPALSKGSKIIINDYVGPGQVGALPFLPERFVRELDMIMLANHNAYERELQDWQRVVTQADDRFGKLKYTPVPMSMMAILELEWDA